MKSCSWCGRMTQSPIRVCSSCVSIERRPAAYSEDDGLTDGAWVLGPRRVLVWEPGCDA